MTQSNHSLSQYLREITKTDLLTAEEETELAARIRNGDEEARTRMIKANLRLVVKIAKDYSGYGLPLADLISEGNIGLMKAVERFDPSMGAKLSTYAAWWIKQSVKRALANQSKTIRLPVHMIDKLAKMRRVAASMADALGHEPSDEEISAETGIPLGKLSLLRRASKRTTSLETPLGGDDQATLGDLIRDEGAVDPAETLENRDLHDQLDGMLGVLNEREARIIDARFGLRGIAPMTLEEVGREFGVSRERIRQIQNIALGKMRTMLRRKDQPLPTPQHC